MSEKKYRIGEVEKICKISKRTLRYYDEIGLLCPSGIPNTNKYRSYTEEELHKIPIIKYYKQSGFKLDDIKKMINKFDFHPGNIEEKFNDKIRELEILEGELKTKKKAVKEWLDLIKEAKTVVAEKPMDINIKMFKKTKMMFLEQKFEYKYMNSIVNIEFNNYIEKMKNMIAGPVIIEFSSFENKCLEKCTDIKIMQKCLEKCESEQLLDFGDILVASYYYIGPYNNIKIAYKKMQDWLKKCGYEYVDKCYERYVVDYWTFSDENKFITEILVPIQSIP